MVSLKAQLLEEVQKVPREFAFRMFEEKLADEGISDDGFCNALTDHLIAGTLDSFSWDDPAYNNLTISISQSETDDLLDRIHEFLDRGLHEVITSTVKQSAIDLKKQLKNQWPERHIFDKTELWGFKERLDLRWAKGLNPLRILLLSSREIGERYAEKLLRSKAKSGISKRNVILLLHMRASQVCLEVLTLLEAGLADGALARWRTLHEVSIVAFLVDKFGDDLAERYLDHDAVAMQRSVENELKHAEGDGLRPVSMTEEKAVRRDYDEVIALYGKEFARPYGWAAKHLALKNPTFQDLERAIGREALPPSYKWSSYKVHAGVSGLLRNLGSLTEEPSALSGASNAGIETPATYTAFTMTQITSLLFGKSTTMETQIEMMCLCLLRDEVAKECKTAARKLAKDEAALFVDEFGEA